MVCPHCGFAARSAGRSDAWIAHETLMGRVSTLPRRRKALLAAGVVVAAGSLVAAVSLLVSGTGGGEGAEPVGHANALPDPVGGAPTRIGPAGTESPDAPTPTGTESPDAPTPTGTASAPARTENPPPSDSKGGYRYEAWAGPGCTTGGYVEHGRFDNGDAGWYTVDSGGFVGTSCDGRFSAVPMSGSPTEDRGNTAVWSWHLGKGFSECALTVFVPTSVNARDVAGNPTFYRVLSDPDNGDSAYTGFAVRQVEHRGSAVDVKSYPVKGDTFAVELIDRGRDWGDADRVGAHHAAAQMKASCR